MRYPKFDPTLSDRARNQKSETAYAVGVLVAELKKAGKDIDELQIGQPLERTPEEICNEAIRAIRAGHHGYTAALGIELARESIAKYFSETRQIKVGKDDVSIEQGAKIYINHAVFAASDHGRGEIIYTTPGYPVYEERIESLGAIGRPISLYEKNGLNFDIDELGRTVNENSRLLILNSPQNPCGSVLSRDELKAIAKIVRRWPKLYVLSDEVYSKFCYDSRFMSIASLPGMQERTIIMDGLSKTYAMTGWRLGFATGNKDIIKSFKTETTNLSGCANHMTQVATVVAVCGSNESLQDEIRNRVCAYHERRDLIVKLLNEIPGVTCLVPGGAFYVYPNVTDACKIVGAKDAKDFHEKLLFEAGVATTADTHFGAKVLGDGEHIRFSYVCSKEVIINAMRRMKEWVESHQRKA